MQFFGHTELTVTDVDIDRNPYPGLAHGEGTLALFSKKYGPFDWPLVIEDAGILYSYSYQDALSVEEEHIYGGKAFYKRVDGQKNHDKYMREFKDRNDLIEHLLVRLEDSRRGEISELSGSDEPEHLTRLDIEMAEYRRQWFALRDKGL